MPKNRSDDALTRLLRAGDPAGGDPGLDPTARAWMRQRMLAAGGEASRQPIGWLLSAATAMALLALALGLALRQPPPLAETVIGTPPTALAAAAGQQIQFTTDSGVLVVWVLQPRQTS